MARIIDKQISVKEKAKTPVMWTWRNRRHRVEQVLDLWRETGRWWAGESEKTFYRIAAGSMVAEIYRDEESGTWFLYRIYD